MPDTHGASSFPCPTARSPWPSGLASNGRQRGSAHARMPCTLAGPRQRGCVPGAAGCRLTPRRPVLPLPVLPLPVLLLPAASRRAASLRAPHFCHVESRSRPPSPASTTPFKASCETCSRAATPPCGSVCRCGPCVAGGPGIASPAAGLRCVWLRLQASLRAVACHRALSRARPHAMLCPRDSPACWPSGLWLTSLKLPFPCNRLHPTAGRDGAAARRLLLGPSAAGKCPSAGVDPAVLGIDTQCMRAAGMGARTGGRGRGGVEGRDGCPGTAVTIDVAGKAERIAPSLPSFSQAPPSLLLLLRLQAKHLPLSGTKYSAADVDRLWAALQPLAAPALP